MGDQRSTTGPNQPRLQHGTAAPAPRASDAGERQPLLSGSAPAASPPSPRTPLPWRSIAILMVVRFAEPVASTVIFPFVNEIVARDGALRLPQSKVGFYSGAIESIFMLCQALTVLQWGRLSDRIGRKPVLLIGMLGTTVSLIGFGLSQHLPAMILTRSIGGFMNGNVGVIKAAFGELTDATNEAVAFAILPLGWSLGAALAPMLGGWTFDRWFHSYPALVPCCLAAIFPLVGFFVCVLFFEETLDSSKREANKAQFEASDAPASSKPASIAQLLGDQNIFRMIATYGAVALIGMAFTALIPLAGWTGIDFGGLGLSEEAIGTALSIQSVFLVLSQSLLFPALHAYMGSLSLLRLTVPFYTVGFALLPIAAFFAQKHQRVAELVAFAIALAAVVFSNTCYSCMMLLVNNSAPTRTSLATMNGIVQTLASFMRAVGPAGVSTLYALSVHNHILNGQLVWVCLLAVGAASIALTWSVKPPRGWRHVEAES